MSSQETNASNVATLDGPGFAGKATVKIINPATEEVMAEYRLDTAEDVDAAVARAKNASKSWGSTPVAERSQILLKIADAIEAQADYFACLESEDVGKPIAH